MQLFELLHPSPQFKAMLVTSHADALARSLAEYLKGLNGSMDLSLYPGEHETVASEQISRTDTIKDYRAPLRCGTREYEAVLLHDILDRHEMPLKLLQLVYRAMENSAEIVVIQRKGSADPYEIEQMIEKAEFRAVNTIGDILEGYDVIVAKKMHMWGNGL
jgi:hypothetical protein